MRAGAGFRRSSMYACINCLKRSSVGVLARAVAARAVAAGAVAAGTVAAGAGAAGQGAAGPSAAEPGEAEAGAAGAEPGAGEPKFVSEAVKPLDSVDLLEPLEADRLDVAGVDPLATPRMAAPCTGARRREGDI